MEQKVKKPFKIVKTEYYEEVGMAVPSRMKIDHYVLNKAIMIPIHSNILLVN